MEVDKLIDELAQRVRSAEGGDKVAILNKARAALHSVSPFKDHPIDFVEWVESDLLKPNDYNPNTVAPPEMKLLELSIVSDGYTQPVVTYASKSGIEIVDGFHRTKVGLTSSKVRETTDGYIPITSVQARSGDRENRIASTVRHNRARGKHGVDAMSDLVIELSKRNWSDKRIAKELGMEPDEVLRLKQVSGLQSMFEDSDFSLAWEIDEDALCAQ